MLCRFGSPLRSTVAQPYVAMPRLCPWAEPPPGAWPFASPPPPLLRLLLQSPPRPSQLAKNQLPLPFATAPHAAGTPHLNAEPPPPSAPQIRYLPARATPALVPPSRILDLPIPTPVAAAEPPPPRPTRGPILPWSRRRRLTHAAGDAASALSPGHPECRAEGGGARRPRSRRRRPHVARSRRHPSTHRPNTPPPPSRSAEPPPSIDPSREHAAATIHRPIARTRQIRCCSLSPSHEHAERRARPSTGCVVPYPLSFPQRDESACNLAFWLHFNSSICSISRHQWALTNESLLGKFRLTFLDLWRVLTGRHPCRNHGCLCICAGTHATKPWLP
ncbi:hypothetical protein PVAP13_5NG306081 [Panicum virgatum]|uniref:Uncharacterized protein n=1 Tax=Panicum virgatum TaxID=38727 RepID=A0A8T0RY27_PANVG|nr:hypothetical protein PVAP13_5NG306081 [Panicum virgatum]